MKWHNRGEASRPQGGASRHCKIILIVLLNSAYEAGCAGHGPVKPEEEP
jgi:hypothetical protein